MRKGFIARVMFMILAVCLTLTSPISVFAGDVADCVIAGADIVDMDTVFEEMAEKYDNPKSGVYCDGSHLYCMDSEGTASGAEIFAWDGQTLTFDGEAFEDADSKAKKKAMRAFTKTLEEEKVSTSCRQNIADMLNQGTETAGAYLVGLTLDSTNADIFTALKWLGPILDFMRILIGVGAIIIILLLVFSTVMDCCYIGLPVWREAQENRALNDGTSKPFMVSMEAISVVKEVESSIDGGNYKNSYLLYFRRRALVYFVLALCVFYLLVGEIGGLIQGLLDMVSGFGS